MGVETGLSRRLSFLPIVSRSARSAVGNVSRVGARRGAGSHSRRYRFYSAFLRNGASAGGTLRSFR